MGIPQNKDIYVVGDFHRQVGTDNIRDCVGYETLGIEIRRESPYCTASTYGLAIVNSFLEKEDQNLIK